MLIVKVTDNGGIERAIKKLRSKVKNTKQLQTLRDNREFVKPSVKKREEMQKARYIQKLRDEEEQ